jgi:RHS repeat-associated protein
MQDRHDSRTRHELRLPGSRFEPFAAGDANLYRPLLNEDLSGDAGFELAVGVGNKRVNGDDSGTPSSRVYDGVTNVLASSTLRSNDRRLNAGSQWDSALGQWRNGVQFENAAEFWDQQDPMAFAAGDTNLYRYVGNDPVNETDPSGLEPPTKPFPEIDPELLVDLPEPKSSIPAPTVVGSDSLVPSGD